MNSSHFIYENRNFTKTLIFFPGWGFNASIFYPIDLHYNYLFIKDPLVPDIKHIIANYVNEKKIEQISLFGWSMGCYPALGCADAFLQKIETIFLISARCQFPTSELTNARNNLKRNAHAYLYSFYKECFYPQQKAFKWFKKTLLPVYRHEISTAYLLEGLDYLAGASLLTDHLNNKMIHFIHGKEDRIADVNEIERFCSTLPQARLSVLNKCGHIPFFQSEFYDQFTL
ncbi:MAG: alpha/beta fold hydrolase [bacterium]